MSYSHRMQRNLIQTSYFAPRGKARMYDYKLISIYIHFLIK